ncbi:sensor histidine kinase [Luteimicrobium sp. DT211]|uniref:sensor histidine kinase n=1 Tax=Luteimicrobium sp. DT211 TaxID=3393412 RepID=UPI003CF2FB5B
MVEATVAPDAGSLHVGPRSGPPWPSAVPSSGRRARYVSTWLVPGLLGLLLGGLLVATPMVWVPVGGLLPRPAETWRVVYGDGYVPGVLLYVSLVMGVLAVAGVVLARARPWLAAVLVALPLASIGVTGVFVWGWWLGALFVAAILAFDAERGRWYAAVAMTAVVVAAAQWYCLSGALAVLPVGLVTAGTDAGLRAQTLIVYLVAIGLLVGGCAVTGILVRWQQRVRARAIRAEAEAHQALDAEAATSERARAARDLHDVVAHHVSLVAVRAESAPYVHPELDATAREVLGDIANDARDALDELRQVLTILQRAGHEDAPRLPQPGGADVAGLVAEATDAGQRVELVGPVPDLPAAQGYVVYRAVQEALTNARRHAPGHPVRVEVEVRSGVVGVRVTNAYDGGPATPAPARGLLGMRERAEALGGAADHAVDDGTFVLSLSLPLSATDAGQR